MESRFKPVEEAHSQGGVKKKYMDKKFKKSIVKALKANNSEPDNIEKIRGHKHLEAFTAERIIEYVNAVSSDVQKNIEPTIDSPEAKEIFKLARLMNVICDNEKPQELPLAIKAKAESNSMPDHLKTHGVQFAELTRFLYSAIKGQPDCTDLKPESLKVLHETHEMLMQKVEQDATPEFIAELKSKICAGYTEQPHPQIAQLAGIFQDKSLNPFSFPFEYLLSGTLPEDEESNKRIEILVVPSNVASDDPPKKKISKTSH